MNEQDIRRIIREELSHLIKSDRFTFEKHIQLLDGRNIQSGTATGSNIGLAHDNKFAFYGATPVVYQGDIAQVIGGGATIDSNCRTTTNALRDALHAYGLC